MHLGRLAILAFICCLAGREPFPATVAYVIGHPEPSAFGSSHPNPFPSKPSETPAPLEGEEVVEWLADCTVETPGDVVLPFLDFKPLISPAFPDSGPYHLSTSKDLLYSIQHLLI